MQQVTKTKANDVFFLGAGFSKAIDSNYETLDGLSDKIITQISQKEGANREHLLKEIPKVYKENIELFLTYLYSNLPYKTGVQISLDEALYKETTNYIADHFLSKTYNNILLENNQVLNNLLRYIVNNKVTCITLNYDLLLEKLLNDSQKPLNKSIDFENLYNLPLRELTPKGSFRVVEEGSLDSIVRKDLPEIIKLHGSINWGSVGLTANDIVYYIADDDEDYKKSSLQTFIVPPVLDKTQLYLNHVLRTAWQRAFNSLKDADNIYIYGFSLPFTDLSVRFLFQSALIYNCKKPNIYVINTANAVDSSDVKNYCKERYLEVFNDYNINFDFCCSNSMENFVNEVIMPKMEG